jgi:NAD(P)H-flavin reductase/ferredoxin
MALIHIQQWPQPIEAGRLRILEAALDAGVPYPHGCGSGECGSCKSLLISGDVTLDRYSPEALSEDERAKGIILACRARLAGDVTVKWLSNAHPLPMVKLNARVAEVGRVAHDVVVLTLSLPQGAALDFRPGQYAKLRVGKLPARSFSMANQPGQGRLEFHVRVLPKGLMSGFIAQQLKAGDSVEVRGPFGDACWEEHLAQQMRGPLLLLAGGTGLAPIMSVLDAALRQGVPGQEIHLYHGVRGERDLYAGAQLHARARARGFRFVAVYSDDPGTGRSGMLHEAVAEDFSSLATARIHVAGPPPMVDAVKKLALQRGASADHIRCDAFYPAEPEKKRLWERITAWGDL